MDRYQLTPLKDRPSQKIGVQDYVKAVVPLVLVPAVGTVLGWLAAKHHAGVNRLGVYLMGHSKDIPNAGKIGAASLGLKIGAIWSVFKIWQHSREQQIGVQDIYQKLQAIEPLHTTNEQLEADNRVLQKMIAHEHGKRLPEAAQHADPQVPSEQTSAEHIHGSQPAQSTAMEHQ